MKQNRRGFLQTAGIAAASIPLLSSVPYGRETKPRFKVSLAEWSLHKALFSKSMTNLGFPVKAAEDFGIFGLEYVSIFFKDTSPAYLNELLKITKDNGVSNVLIMVDHEGDLANSDDNVRNKGVEYEGTHLSEPDGIMATKKLLDKIIATL